MITVTQAAETIDLTTLETVRAELEIDGSEQDERIQTLITQASGVIGSHCQRVFGLETVQETFRLDRMQLDLILSRFPVVAVTSITEGQVTLSASDYEIDKSRGIIARLHGSRVCHWSTCKILVTYSSGFALLGDLPFGVERACIQLVKAWFFASDRDPMIRSESVTPMSSAVYFGGAEHLPPDVIGLLKPHRNVRTR